MTKLFYLSFVIFLLAVTAFSYVFIDQNLIYLHEIYLHLSLFGKWTRVIGYLIMVVGFFCYYFYILYLQRAKKLSQRDIKKLIITTVICLFFAYPAMLSFDIFNYIATAKVTFFYGENPYIIMPIEFTGDKLLLFMHAANKTALYGPVWIFISSIPFILGIGNFLATMFLFKGLVISFYLLSLFLIYKLSKSYYSVLFFGLNPLVVIETLVSGHNDIVMIALLLLSYLLFMQRRLTSSLLFFLLSIFIKFATITLLPLYAALFVKSFKNEKIDWERIFDGSFYFLFLIFLFSFLREEIYPWYAIWFLPFVAITNRKRFQNLTVIFSFSLLMRYMPFMIFSTHFGITPIVKTTITFLPLFVAIIWIGIKDKVWLKLSSH